MCYATDRRHQPSCMVCMVKDVHTGQMIPSCSTLPREGMEIEADTEEVLGMRRQALELLLSDHRADCEAPCTIVCPRGIDVARVLLHYDRGELSAAAALLGDTSCDGCKAPCERACRRRTVDEAVSIRSLLDEVRRERLEVIEKTNRLQINQTSDETSDFRLETSDNSIATDLLADHSSDSLNRRTKQEQRQTCLHYALRGGGRAELKVYKSDSLEEASNPSPLTHNPKSDLFNSRLGRFTDAEKERMKQLFTQPSRCLHCACEGSGKCRLRELATKAGIRTPKYGVQSSQPVKERIKVTERLVYEPAKCIRCGLCVYNTDDGFTFERRGFDMRVVIPEESKSHVGDEVARLCPTGALHLRVLTLLLPLLMLFSGCGQGGQKTSESVNSNMGTYEWTSFRGSSSLAGYTDSPLPDNPTLLWEYRHGVRTVAAPIVSHGTVYMCDKHGQLRGFSTADGTPTCSLDLGGDVEAPFVTADSLLYIGQMDGQVRALSLTDGAELWHFETEGQILASPTLLPRGVLVVGSYDNTMYTLDARTGDPVGRASTGYYINGAAAIWRDTYALFGGCDAWLRVSDLRTGHVTDSIRLDAYLPASPAVEGDYAYVNDYQGNLYEIRLTKDGHIGGHRVMLAAEDDEGGTTSMPTVTADAVFVLAEGRFLVCIDRADAHVRWKQMLRGDVGECSPLVCGDRVLVCTRTGIISIHDARTGRCLWTYETGEQIVASPAVAAGRLFVLTARGTLLCFN